MNARRIILVTGSPRSGTTAVGRVLSYGRGVCNLHEPLNYHVGLRTVQRYFEIAGTGGFMDDDVVRLVDSIRRLRLRFKPGVFPGDTGVRRYAKRMFGGRARMSYRRCRFEPGVGTIIWKDPFACFLAATLATEHDVQVVVTLRNPWAVAGSFKRMGWAFDLADIHERLVEAGVPGLPKLDPSAIRSCDPALNGAALWTLVYSVLDAASRRSERLRFLDLDRVVAEPMKTYAELYEHLNLPWASGVERRIRNNYGLGAAQTAAPRSRRAHDQRRDLGAVNTYWSGVLDEAEAEAVTRTSGTLWESVRR